MSIYALIKENKVVNLVESEADFVASLRYMFPEIDDVVIVSEDKGLAYINGEYVNGRFKPIKPYESWIFDESTWTWEAPKPKPEGLYVWDEEAVDWVEFTPPAIETPAE